MIRKIDTTSLYTICILYYINVNSEEYMVLCGIVFYSDKNLEHELIFFNGKGVCLVHNLWKLK